MSEYRNDIREVERETRWTIARFIPTILVVVILFGGIGAGTRYLGMWGDTTMERVIFKSSYQRSAALEERIAVNEATLAEINSQLRNSSLEDDVRNNLEAQAAAIRIRIATARSQQ